MSNFYVRPNGGSYGLEDGSDWNNAFDGFGDINFGGLNPGDTVWIAGGTYTQSLSPTTGGSSGNPISFRRARVDSVECTGASGWDSAFASTVTHDSSSINILTSISHLTFSGATSSSGGTHGWHITFVGDTAGEGVFYGNGVTATNILIEWVDIEGPGNVTYSSDGRGIDATPLTGSSSALIISHCKIHGWESTVYLAGIDDVVFEYCEIYDVRAVNSVTFHPNAFWILDSDNFTLRYSRMHGYVGEGVFWTNNDTDVSGAQIYGNLFYDTQLGGNTTKVLQADNTGTFTGLMVFNNTFDNCYNIMAGDSLFSGCEARNNIISRNLSGAPFGGFTTSNNLTTTDASVFVDRATENYNIPSDVGVGFARDAGTDLSGFFTVDMNGNPYDENGAWDIGALAFDGDDPPPAGATLDTTNLNATTLTIG